MKLQYSENKLQDILLAMARADVVIADGHDGFVILQFRLEDDYAPKVVARGSLDSIEKRTADSGKPFIRHPELFFELSTRVPVGSEIPEDLYAPVVRAYALIHAHGRAMPPDKLERICRDIDELLRDGGTVH